MLLPLINESMWSDGAIRLINADEMLLNYYPKETNFLDPSNANIVGSNLSEDGEKGCSVMVACEIFKYKTIAIYFYHDWYL